MSAASEKQMGVLHGRIAQVMSGALDVMDKAQTAYLADETGEAIEPETNSALLSVMVRFLNDNKITCALDESEEMSALEKKLQEKRLKRTAVGDVQHIDDYR